MRTIAITLILAAVFIFSGQTEARKHARKGHMSKMMKELNLTADQQQKVKKIKSEFKGKIKPLKTKMKAMHAKVEKLFVDGTDEALRTEHKNVVEFKPQIHAVKFEKMMAIRALLTPEQRKKFFEMKHKKHKRGMEDED